MAGIKLEFKTKDLGFFDEIQKKLSKDELVQLNKNIGAQFVASTRLRFRSKDDPTGKVWPFWNSEDYRKRQNKKGRREPGNIGLDTGRLRNSIAYKADSKGVTVGTNVIYAGTFQAGNSALNILARPFLGVSRDDQDELRDLLEDYLEVK